MAEKGKTGISDAFHTTGCAPNNIEERCDVVNLNDLDGEIDGFMLSSLYKALVETGAEDPVSGFLQKDHHDRIDYARELLADTAELG